MNDSTFLQRNNSFPVALFSIFRGESFYPVSNPKGFTSPHSISERFTLASWRTEIDSFQGIKRAPRYAQKPYVFHPGKFAASPVVERIRWSRSKRPTTSIYLSIYLYMNVYIDIYYICRVSSISCSSICNQILRE